MTRGTRAPIVAPMSPYASYLVEVTVTLGAVCALAFVVLWGARKVGVGRAQGPIALAGQLPLDARRAIYLVRIGAQVIVVGAGDGGMTKLGELPASELPPDGGRGAGASFAAMLGKALGRKPPRPDAEAP